MKERVIKNKDDFLLVEFSNLTNEYIHFHQETEIILVLRGSINCKIHYVDYPLEQGDVILVDSEDLHYFHNGSEDFLCVRMYIDLKHYEEVYPDIEFMVFVCEKNNLSESEEKNLEFHIKLNVVKEFIAHIAEAAYKGGSERDIEELMNDFVDILVSKFRGFFVEKNNFLASDVKVNVLELERIERISKYIFENLEKKITLEEIANMESLSIYYLSHLIKNNFGVGFQGLLNYLRIEGVEKLLLDKKLSLTEVCGFSGFSTPAYMKKTFLDYYGITPTEYRKNIKLIPKTYGDDFTTEEALELLYSYYAIDQSKKRNSQNREILLSSGYDDKCIRNISLKTNLIVSNIEELISIHYLKEILENIGVKCIIIELDEKKKSINYELLNEMIYALQKKNLKIKIVNYENDVNEKLDLLCQKYNIERVISKLAEETKKENIINNFLLGKDINVTISEGQSGIYRGNFLTEIYRILQILFNITGDLVFDKEISVIKSRHFTTYILSNIDNENSISYEIIDESFWNDLVVSKTNILMDDYFLNDLYQKNLCKERNDSLIKNINDKLNARFIFDKPQAKGSMRSILKAKGNSIAIMRVDVI